MSITIVFIFVLIFYVLLEMKLYRPVLSFTLFIF